MAKYTSDFYSNISSNKTCLKLLLQKSGPVENGFTNDYLFRASLQSNEKTCIHIGFLGFTSILNNPGFYSEYLLSDTKNHNIYSNKFSLRVLDLSPIDKATKTQKQSKLYYWAQLFKATTWEEIRMLADKNETIQDTVFTLMELTEDDKIRVQCEARERYDREVEKLFIKEKSIEEISDLTEKSTIANK